MTALVVHSIMSEAKDVVEDLLSNEIETILLERGWISSWQSRHQQPASPTHMPLNSYGFLTGWTIKFPLAHRVSVSIFPEPHLAIQAAAVIAADLPNLDGHATTYAFFLTCLLPNPKHACFSSACFNCSGLGLLILRRLENLMHWSQTLPNLLTCKSGRSAC